jgi:hypothetical protein
MLVILIIVLVAHAVDVSAGQFQGHGYFWADQICSNTDGLCYQPFLLGLSAGLVTGAYFLILFLAGESD